MKKLGILLIFIISFFSSTSYVAADICDNEHISQIEALAEQVDVKYEYIDNSKLEKDEGESEYTVNTYSISVNLISDELYLNDGFKDYHYSDSNNGIINLNLNSGTRQLTLHSRRCGGYKIKTMTLKLPKFNIYSYKQECEKLEKYNLDVCDEWYQGTLNDNLFYKEVNKYLENDNLNTIEKIINLFKNNYLIIIAGLIAIIIIITGIIMHRKRSVLE